jgi:hypothetical protein
MSAHPSDALLASLLAAVEAAPDDVPLRLHVAELLLGRGRGAEALQHCSRALAKAPADPAAVALLQRVTAALAGPPTSADEPTARLAPKGAPRRGPPARAGAVRLAPAEEQLSELPDVDTGPVPVEQPATRWSRTSAAARPPSGWPTSAGWSTSSSAWSCRSSGRCANPEMARAFGKGLAGGLLLYGPPGCGKTFLARAVAGELGAGFTEVGIADVLDMWVGRSERNLAEVFRAARRKAPHVLFLDEIDALGRKRSHLAHASSLRNTVNQLLTEMDSLAGRNDGVFVLGATNHPWDLDSALRRPGRFDRMLLVLPPDPAARAAILRHNLASARSPGSTTTGWSGSPSTTPAPTWPTSATPRPSGRWPSRCAPGRCAADHRRPAGRGPRGAPSTGPWFATARNVALFGNADGSYDELAAYLKKNRRCERARERTFSAVSGPASTAPGPAEWAERAEHLRAIGRLVDAEQAARAALADEPQDGALLGTLSAVLLSAERYRRGWRPPTPRGRRPGRRAGPPAARPAPDRAGPLRGGGARRLRLRVRCCPMSRPRPPATPARCRPPAGSASRCRWRTGWWRWPRTPRVPTCCSPTSRATCPTRARSPPRARLRAGAAAGPAERAGPPRPGRARRPQPPPGPGAARAHRRRPDGPGRAGDPAHRRRGDVAAVVAAADLADRGDRRHPGRQRDRDRGPDRRRDGAVASALLAGGDARDLPRQALPVVRARRPDRPARSPPRTWRWPTACWCTC